MSEIKAEWTNKDNLGTETTASDYIKREDAKKQMCECMLNGRIYQYIMDELPTADVEPVRHGYWEQLHDRGGFPISQCTACGKRYHLNDIGFNYCPNCGAKMDKMEEQKDGKDTDSDSDM